MNDEPNNAVQDELPEDPRPAVEQARRLMAWVVSRAPMLLRALIYFCLGLVVVDAAFLFGVDKHAHFAWENRLGFYGVIGFVAVVVLVVIARWVLRPVTMRREDYYD